MRTINTFKKILSLMVSIAMIFTTVPLTVFAVDTGGFGAERKAQKALDTATMEPTGRKFRCAKTPRSIIVKLCRVI